MNNEQLFNVATYNVMQLLENEEILSFFER